MKNKVLSLIMAAIILLSASAIQPISALPSGVTSPAQWSPSLRDLAGFSSVGSWSLNQTAEYYETNFTVITNGTCWIAEFQVPDGYMGLDVWAWNGTAWVLKNGASGYSLSVPYMWNFTDKITGSAYTTSIPADWGSGSFVVALPSAGSLYRVQLRVDENAQLKIKIRYGYGAGLDGVDDRILFLDSNPQTSETVNIVFKVYDINKESAFFGKNDFAAGTYYLYTDNNAYSWARYYDGNFYNNWGGSSLPAYQVINATVELKPSFPLQISINGTTTNGNMLPSELVTNNAEFVVGSLWNGILPSIINFISVKKSNLETNVLFFNGTHFVDLSGNNNHGTPYGNVQYKVYTGTGFKASFAYFTATISKFAIQSTNSIISPAWDFKTGSLAFTSGGNVTVVSGISRQLESVAAGGAATQYIIESYAPLTLTINNLPNDLQIVIDFEDVEPYIKYVGIGDSFNGYQYVLDTDTISRYSIESESYSKLAGFDGWQLAIQTMGTGQTATETLEPITYVSLNSTSWLLVFNTTGSKVMLYAAEGPPTVFANLEAPEAFFLPTNITQFFSGFYGAALWGALWTLPAAMTYVRTKNAANSAIVLGFMMSIGSFMAAELRPFAVLAMGVAVGALLFRLLRPKQSEQ